MMELCPEFDVLNKTSTINFDFIPTLFKFRRTYLLNQIKCISNKKQIGIWKVEKHDAKE